METPATLKDPSYKPLPLDEVRFTRDELGHWAGRSRIQIDASKELRTELERLAAELGVSVRALVLYTLADKYPRLAKVMPAENIRRKHGTIKRVKVYRGPVERGYWQTIEQITANTKEECHAAALASR